MWSIKHPSVVFDYLTKKTDNKQINALMLKEKFFSFDSYVRNILTNRCTIDNVKIMDPNNPAKLLDAIFIHYEFNDII